MGRKVPGQSPDFEVRQPQASQGKAQAVLHWKTEDSDPALAGPGLRRHWQLEGRDKQGPTPPGTCFPAEGSETAVSNGVEHHDSAICPTLSAICPTLSAICSTLSATVAVVTVLVIMISL